MTNTAQAKFDKDIHFNHGKPWKTSDINYLIKFWNVDSYASLSAVLGRTYKTIADRVYNLKKTGQIKE